MTRPFVAAVLAGTVVIAGHAQSQSVVVAGRVVSAETGDPLPHARVIVYTDALPLPSVFTDGQGRFASQPVPASGRYRLSVTKAGYALTSVAGASLTSSDLDVRMPRAAAISGRVVDVLGEPAAGVPVSLYHDRPPAPGSPPSKRVTTDDFGEYRFGGLAEGTYFVNTTTQRQSETTGRFEQTNTYFPGVAAPADAQGITVKAGDERTAVDFAGIDVQPNALTVGATNTVILVNGTPTVPRPIAGSAVIRGTVTRTDGLPLVHATVTTTVPQGFLLGQNRVPGPKSVQTDENGNYELGDLPAGTYRVVAGKLGYTGAAYGNRADDPQTGTPIQIAEGQIKTKIDITLPRYSAMTGHVLDEYGDPVENVMVTASQIRFSAGRRRLSNVGLNRPTDDLGRYRLYGFQPGQYIVTATPGQVLPNQPMSDLSGYAPTYFPGTPTAAEAQFVPVPRSQDVTGLDFVLVPTPTATISGRKLGSDGQPMGGSLTLMQSNRSGAIVTPGTGARIEDDGRFEFPNVAPGDYVIQADRGTAGPGVEGDFVAQFVTVSGTDVPGVLLQATPGSTLSGRVVFDGDGPSPSVRALRIVPERADLDRTPNSIARGDVAQDLTFRVSGLHGPRRIGVEGAPPGWSLKSVVAAGADVTDAPLPFGAPDQSLSDVQVILTNRVTELIGTVVNARGEPTREYTLLVFPEDRERWYAGSRYFRRASPEARGFVDVRGLPPGEYFVAPVFGVSVLRDGADAWQDPEFLESIAQRAARATLTEGQKLSISARVITP